MSINSIKGSFCNGERIYEVSQNDEIFEIFQQNRCQQFRIFATKVLHGLDFLQSKHIVHTDLKSENILISFE